MTLTDAQKLAHTTMMNNLEWGYEQLEPVVPVRELDEIFFWDRFPEQRPQTEPDWKSPDFHDSPIKSIVKILDAFTVTKSDPFTPEFLELWERLHASLLRGEDADALQAVWTTRPGWTWAEMGVDSATGQVGPLDRPALVTRIYVKLAAQAKEVADYLESRLSLGDRDAAAVALMQDRAQVIVKERDLVTTMR